MSQYRNAYLCLGQMFFEYLLYFIGPAKFIAFGHHDEVDQLLASLLFLERLDDVLDICFSFRDEDVFRAGSDTTMKGDVSRVTTHYFNDKDPVMGIHRVPDLVNSLYRRVHGCIESNGEITAI